MAVELRTFFVCVVRKVITPNSEKFSIRFFKYLLPSALADGELKSKKEVALATIGLRNSFYGIVFYTKHPMNPNAYPTHWFISRLFFCYETRMFVLFEELFTPSFSINLKTPVPYSLYMCFFKLHVTE
jgi:hypothetical protein